MSDIIKLDRRIWMKCNCGSFDWSIEVDKPDFTNMLSIQCQGCGIEIQIEKIKEYEETKKNYKK